jgi:sugar/nucleoside kinase (ribokinase family)
VVTEDATAKTGRDFDIVVIGDCNPDIVLRGDVEPEFGQHEKLVEDAAFVVGGSGSITACACAAAGLRTAFIGATGDDAFGGFMRRQLELHGVDASMSPVLAGQRTGFSVILSGGQDRAILTFAGTIDRLGPEHLPVPAVARAAHVHVSSYFLQPRLALLLPGLFGALREAGLTVSVDPNWDPSGEWDGGLAALMGAIDVFLPNRAEAEALSGQGGVASAALDLARRGPLVVVKDGVKGCTAARGGSVWQAPAFPTESVDSTGAGDSFDAGFLSAWLRHLPLERCLAYACTAGALSTRALGATGALATAAELEHLAGGP